MTVGPLNVRIVLTALVAVAVMFCASASSAESGGPLIEILVLKNGDRVSGWSIGLTEGTLRWRMPYGEELDIPLAMIERIEQVEDGDVPEDDGPALPPPESNRPVDDVPPVIELPPEKPVPKEPAKVDPAVTPASAEVPPVLAEPLSLTKAWHELFRANYAFLGEQSGKWTKRFELGGTWVDGNTETSEAYIGGIFERQFDRVYNQLDWNGRHVTTGSEVTQSRWQFNGTTDFAKDKKAKWILFATHRHLFDQLADLDYRGTYASGVGYRFFNETEKRLIARLGPGATVEKYDPPLGTRITPDLFAEAEARWPVFDRTLVEYKSTFTPSLDDTSVFRVTTNYGLLVKLDDKEKWAMRVGLRHEHNSRPNAGRKEDDFTTTFTLVYTRDKPKKASD